MLISKINGKPEIFYTFQGEGINIGKPVIFIRTAGCNLHCKWCDTWYTWFFKNSPWKHDSKKKVDITKHTLQMSVEEIVDALSEMIDKHNCHRVTITGGEPLIHQVELLKVIEGLKGIQFDFETNGTILPNKELFAKENVYFNCSPKLANSGNAKKLRYKPEVIEALIESNKASFKFVVDKASDLREIKAIASECLIPKEIIYLMPQGITKKGISLKEVWLAGLCKLYGFNLTTRLHVLVYGGARRGV